MDCRTMGPTDCTRCVWFEPSEDGSNRCPYRTAATASNTAWRQINTGRCTHFLAVADER